MRSVSGLITTLVVILVLSAIAASGCSAPTPTGSATPASAASPKTASGYPAEVLDLKNWYLTLPTGKPGDPDTIHQPELATYSGDAFRLNDARDGVVFTANAGGATTKGSTYPRSELREMNGTEKASWSNTSGTHTLSVRQAVTALPPAKPQVVTAQIHDATDDVLEVRVEDKRLIAQYDDNGKTNIVMDPAYTLGTPYELRIVAASSRVEVYYNGAKKADIPKSGSDWYFKSGSYLQSNTSKGDEAGAVGTVVIYSLQVTHSG